MWGTIIKVAYMVKFTDQLKQDIIKHIKPSLIANNEEGTNQYYLQDLKDNIEDETIVSDTAFDNAIILQMDREEINYFEF